MDLLNKKFHIKYSDSINKRDIIEWVQNKFSKRFKHKLISFKTKYQLDSYFLTVSKDIDPTVVSANYNTSTKILSLVGKYSEVQRITDIIRSYQFPTDKESKNSRLSLCPKPRRLFASSTNEREKDEVTFRMSGLKWYQIDLLRNIQYIEKLNNSLQLCHIELDFENKAIQFTSTSKEELEIAKSQVVKTLRTIVGAEIQCENKQKVINHWKTKTNFYIHAFKEENLPCVIDTKSFENTLLIYSTSYEKISKCQNILLNKKF